MSAAAIWESFQREYLIRETPLKLNSVHTSSAAGEKDQLTVNVYVDGELRELQGSGNGPIAAFLNAITGLGDERFEDVRLLDYHEHALSAGGDAIAAAYVEMVVGDDIALGCRPGRQHRHRLAQGRDLGGQPVLRMLRTAR